MTMASLGEIPNDSESNMSTSGSQAPNGTGSELISPYGSSQRCNGVVDIASLSTAWGSLVRSAATMVPGDACDATASGADPSGAPEGCDASGAPSVCTK